MAEIKDTPELHERQNLYLGNEKLKKAGVKIGFTPEQQVEWIRCKLDQEYFIRNYVKIVSTSEGIINMQPFDYQLEMMAKLKDNNHVICLTSRQAGKCVTLNTNVTVRNKRTGKIEKITMGALHERIRAKQTNNSTRASESVEVSTCKQEAEEADH